MHNIDPQVKEHIIEQHLRYGRTLRSLADEFGIPASTLSRMIRKYRADISANDERAKALAAIEENRRLREELEAVKKENDFLKKAAAFFAKESK